MNNTLIKALIVFVPTVLLLIRSGRLARHHAGVAPVIQLCGSASLMIVVFTHIAEALQLFSAMHWGSPDSAGHYLDLASALLAVTLLPVGLWMEWRRT